MRQAIGFPRASVIREAENRTLPHEVSICGKEGHLTVRIATIGAMRVGLNELSDRETISGFFGRDRQVLTHGTASLKTRVWREFRATPRSRIGHIHGRRR